MGIPLFRKFKDVQPKKAGFYVFRYHDGHTLEVYADEPERHYADVYSYFVTMPNTRDPPDWGSDFGQYVWCNTYHIHHPVEWRRMTAAERRAFRRRLFCFDRPSWCYPRGRAHPECRKAW